MIRIEQLKIDVKTYSEESLEKLLAKKLQLPTGSFKYFIRKRSIDARKKNQIFYTFVIDIETPLEKELLKKNLKIQRKQVEKEEYVFLNCGTHELKERPVIIGCGPAGLMTAYFLAYKGFQPLVIERGETMEERVISVQKFWEEGILNPESNVQFGEGGAGTFSDGKLNTLVKDEKFRGKKIFEILVECGAPKEILYDYKPHIGTDILRKVIQNLRKKIEDMGGSFLFQSKLTDIIIENKQVKKIIINEHQEIDCSVLVLALGHSARDTFELLERKGFPIKAKPFAVGLRISHLQEELNIAQYKEYASYLPPATYKLTYNTKNRGIYTFCMCPGGYIVNASSEEKSLAINGMSNSKRDTKNANSAIVVTVFPKDFGDKPLDGMYFQRKLEKKAYQLGKGKIPIETFEDYCNHSIPKTLGRIKPICKGTYSLADLNELFQEEINEVIKEAIYYFGTKIEGFSQKDALLAGIESRTSSPIQIARNEDLETIYSGIYPCGEGAGYAGGITSAMMDGIKVAEKIIEKYCMRD